MRSTAVWGTCTSQTIMHSICNAGYCDCKIAPTRSTYHYGQCPHQTRSDLRRSARDSTPSTEAVRERDIYIVFTGVPLCAFRNPKSIITAFSDRERDFVYAEGRRSTCCLTKFNVGGKRSLVVGIKSFRLGNWV